MFKLLQTTYIPISGIHEMVHRQGLDLERSTSALSYQGTAPRFGAYRAPPGSMCIEYEIAEWLSSIEHVLKQFNTKP